MADFIKNRKFYLRILVMISKYKIHILCYYTSLSFSSINCCRNNRDQYYVSILQTDYDSNQSFCRRVPFGEGGISQMLLFLFTCFICLSPYHQALSIYTSLLHSVIFQVDANRTKEAVFEDLEKVFDSWIGDHGSDSYIVVCDECNRNTVTICPHIKH